MLGARQWRAKATVQIPNDAPVQKERPMPLSEEEQKILKEIEAQLNATDPALVEQVSRTTLYRHSARMIRWAALGFLGGLVLLVLHCPIVEISGTHQQARCPYRSPQQGAQPHAGARQVTSEGAAAGPHPVQPGRRTVDATDARGLLVSLPLVGGESRQPGRTTLCPSKTAAPNAAT